MNVITRSLIALSFLAALLPSITLQAQDGAENDESRTPDARQAQIIAHGVAHLPGPSIAWQIGLREARRASQVAATERPVGFLLADEGTIAITDDQGEVLQRLTPGQAVWTEPGQQRAAVSLDDRRHDYYQIGLVASVGEGRTNGALTHDAFDASTDQAIEIELLRGVLNRAEEQDIPGSETPSLILVTRGKVFVETGRETLQLSRSESVQLDGAAVVVGASRSPASYVVARIGSSVPVTVRLSGALPPAAPGSVPVATPVEPPSDSSLAGDELEHGRGRTLSLAIRACPAGMIPERITPDLCMAAPPGTTLSLQEADSDTPLGVAQALPSAWAWTELDAGRYGLDVNALPEGFETAVLDDEPCCGAEHDFSLVFPRAIGQRERTLFLLPPAESRDISLTIAVLACPPGMTAQTLIAEWCTPAPPGTVLSLSEWGIPLGVSAVSANAWTWQDLGPLNYRLQVHALPGNFDRYQLGTEPCCADADAIEFELSPADADAQRTLYLFQPPDPAGADDADQDGLPFPREMDLGTHPFLPDSDDDGILDGEEVNLYGTDPLRLDTDGDRLGDAEELLIHGTNPLLADTDGDGLRDDREVAAGSDPLDFTSLPATPTPEPTATPFPSATPWPTATPSPAPEAATPPPTPGPQQQPSPEDALDGDGLSALDEIVLHRTSPIRADTDDDGINDGDEVAAGTDPRDPENR